MVRLFQKKELVSSLMSILLEAGCSPVIDFYLVFKSMEKLSRKGVCPGGEGKELCQESSTLAPSGVLLFTAALACLCPTLLCQQQELPSHTGHVGLTMAAFVGLSEIALKEQDCSCPPLSLYTQLPSK